MKIQTITNTNTNIHICVMNMIIFMAQVTTRHLIAWVIFIQHPCPALPSKGKKTVALTGAAITLFLHVHANVTIWKHFITGDTIRAAAILYQAGKEMAVRTIYREPSHAVEPHASSGATASECLCHWKAHWQELAHCGTARHTGKHTGRHAPVPTFSVPNMKLNHTDCAQMWETTFTKANAGPLKMHSAQSMCSGSECLCHWEAHAKPTFPFGQCEIEPKSTNTDVHHVKILVQCTHLKQTRGQKDLTWAHLHISTFCTFANLHMCIYPHFYISTFAYTHICIYPHLHLSTFAYI